MAKTKGANASKKKAANKTKASSPAKEKGIPRAAPEVAFVLVDGRRLYDYKELADSLEELEEHIWNHHVNTERNDFANWVNDVFKEAELAERIRDAKGKHHAQIVIYRHILENA